jgi:hypothetical protein
VHWFVNDLMSDDAVLGQVFCDVESCAIYPLPLPPETMFIELRYTLNDSTLLHILFILLLGSLGLRIDM